MQKAHPVASAYSCDHRWRPLAAEVDSFQRANSWPGHMEIAPSTRVRLIVQSCSLFCS